MDYKIRTDLALEAREIWSESAGKTTKLPGVEAEEYKKGSFKVSTVRILNGQGERELGKPVGNYITIELDGLIRREENAFNDAVQLLAEQLRSVLELSKDSTVLVAGLGNISITPDAVGPESVNCVMVTRHLKERLPEHFGEFREVSAVQTGVLATTGMESAELIKAIAQRLKPDKVIAIDALASRKMKRLCRTLQIADTGIVPGSGVGNSRAALNYDTLGIPVIAIGVPTVVDAFTLANDIMGDNGVTDISRDRINKDRDMIVTPRDIDKRVTDVSKLIGYGINVALHDGLTIEDVDMFLS